VGRHALAWLWLLSVLTWAQALIRCRRDRLIVIQDDRCFLPGRTTPTAGSRGCGRHRLLVVLKTRGTQVARWDARPFSFWVGHRLLARTGAADDTGSLLSSGLRAHGLRDGMLDFSWWVGGRLLAHADAVDATDSLLSSGLG
jgi:hypothetical protein